MDLKITGARVSFAHGLFTATAFEDGGEKKYGADFILSPGSKVYKVNADKTLTPITVKAAELEAAVEGWKAKGAEVLEDLEPSKKSLRNGNRRKNKSGEIYQGYEGCWYITSKNKSRPTLVGPDAKPVTEEDGVIYSGCYVTVFLTLYPNTKPTTRGVFSGLQGVQKTADGESFGGGRTVGADAFEPVTEGTGADDFA